MIDDNKLAEFIEDDLNEAIALTSLGNATNSTVYRFRIVSDVGDYLGYEYLEWNSASQKYVPTDKQTNKVVKYINAYMNAESSTVNGVDKYEYTYGVGLAFLVPIITKNKKEKYNELVESIRNVINSRFYKNREGSIVVDNDNYDFGITFSLVQTGSRDMRAPVGDSVELDTFINFYFVEAGLNSSQFHLYIDGQLVPSTRVGYNRATTSKAVQKSTATNDVTRNIEVSSVFTLNFDLPARNDTIDGFVRAHLYANTNPIRYVELKIQTGVDANEDPVYESYNYYMRFETSTLATEEATYASQHAKMIEAHSLDDSAEMSTYAYNKAHPST